MNKNNSLLNGSNSKATQLFDGVVIFTQVVNSGSFVSAATATGHSNSYISKEINKLESRLGVRLLNRTTRSISLTPEGRVYFEQCQQLVLDAQGAMATLNQSQLTPRGTLKISCPISFSQEHLHNIISDYMRLYPEVDLVLDLNDRQVDLIQDGFDLVIRATDKLAESSLVSRRIYRCKSYTVASKAYLAKAGWPTRPEQLVEHQCICYSNLTAPNRWHYQNKSGDDIYVDVHCKLLCNSAGMELAMVLADKGICRLPEFAMAQAMKNKELEVLFEDYPAPIINVYAIYPSRKHLSPKVRSFIDLLVKNMPKGSN
ncbi:LysR family transcriptional regulator [Colwellia sp. D2M02]|uniref:LysR family transcriptional regulator n=1 Tax=Colwellia sp. D2M02 TaxID=2841562 RepID=UPI001C09DC6E|nr:LysR family transcriptional regulator [Colwellia sp. D2M02]MBU2892708.1 LysR family transcriptional regulator [Colwellia sp. D2M02]